MKILSLINILAMCLLLTILELNARYADENNKSYAVVFKEVTFSCWLEYSFNILTKVTKTLAENIYSWFALQVRTTLSYRTRSVS